MVNEIDYVYRLLKVIGVMTDNDICFCIFSLISMAQGGTPNWSWYSLFVSGATTKKGSCLFWLRRKLGGGNSNICYFHPKNWGTDPI